MLLGCGGDRWGVFDSIVIILNTVSSATNRSSNGAGLSSLTFRIRSSQLAGSRRSTILTTAANDYMIQLHDRMPVILEASASPDSGVPTGGVPALPEKPQALV